MGNNTSVSEEMVQACANPKDALTEVLKNVNPTDGQVWVFKDFSIDTLNDPLNSTIYSLSKLMGLQCTDNSLVQTSAIVISYAALSEFAQQVVGIGGGMAKLDFHGIALAKLDKKVDKILGQVGALLKQPLKSARQFLNQAEVHIKIGEVARAVELLKDVNKSATEARSLADENVESKDVKVEALLASTQLLILVDVLLQSCVSTSNGPIFMPYIKLSDHQRYKISELVRNHLRELMTMLEKIKSGRFTKMLNFIPSHRKKEEKKQDKIDGLLRSVFSLMTTKTREISSTTYTVETPETNFIPQGAEDMTYCTISPPAGPKFDMFLYSEQNSIVVWFKGCKYTVNLDKNNTDQTLVITIDNDVLVKANKGAVEKNSTLEEFFKGLDSEYWNTLQLETTAALVAYNLVKEVKRVRLHKGKGGVTEEDLTTVTTVLPLVTEEVVLVNFSPCPMVWRDIQDSIPNTVKLFKLRDCEVCAESGQAVGTISSKVCNAELCNVKFSKFGDFATGVTGVLGGSGEKEDSSCKQLEFSGDTAKTYKNKIEQLAENIGWKATGNTVIVVRKKD